MELLAAREPFHSSKNCTVESTAGSFSELPMAIQSLPTCTSSGKTHSKKPRRLRRGEGFTPRASRPQTQVTVHPGSSFGTLLLVLDLGKLSKNKLKTHTGFRKALDSSLSLFFFLKHLLPISRDWNVSLDNLFICLLSQPATIS